MQLLVLLFSIQMGLLAASIAASLICFFYPDWQPPVPTKTIHALLVITLLMTLAELMGLGAFVVSVVLSNRY